jgi:phage terminase large subunit
VRETVDRFDKSVTKQFGYNTNKKTKPLMLANLVELVREHTDIFNDEKTLRQMLTFVKKDGGKQEAEEGYHDDKVMSIAITHQATSQVVFPIEPIIMPSRYSFNIEKQSENQYDYGEEITIV